MVSEENLEFLLKLKETPPEGAVYRGAIHDTFADLRDFNDDYRADQKKKEEAKEEKGEEDPQPSDNGSPAPVLAVPQK